MKKRHGKFWRSGGRRSLPWRTALPWLCTRIWDIGYPVLLRLKLLGLPIIPYSRSTARGTQTVCGHAVGDLYQNGRWHELYPVGFWVTPNENVPKAVQEKMEEEDSRFSILPLERLDLSLLAGFQTTPFATLTDVIRMTPIGSLENFPDGPLPTSLHVHSIDTLAYLWAHNATFVSSEPVSEYTWTSKIPVYSESQLGRLPYRQTQPTPSYPPASRTESAKRRRRLQVDTAAPT